MNSYGQPTESSPNLNIESKPQDVICPVCNKLTPYEERCRYCATAFLPPQTSGAVPSIQPNHSFAGYPPQQSGFLPQRSGYYPPQQSAYYPPQFGYPQQNFNPYPQQNFNPYPQQNFNPYPQQNFNPYPPQNFNPYPPQKAGYGWIITLLCSILAALIVACFVIVSKLNTIIDDLYYYSYDYSYDYGYEDDYYEDEKDPYGGLFDFGVPEDESDPLPENDNNKPGEIIFNNIGVLAHEPRLIKVEEQGTYLIYTIILTNLGEEIVSLTPENFTLKIEEIDVKSTSEVDEILDVKSMKNTAIAAGEEIRTKLIFKIDEGTVSADIYIEDETDSSKILTSKFS